MQFLMALNEWQKARDDFEKTTSLSKMFVASAVEHEKRSALFDAWQEAIDKGVRTALDKIGDTT